MKKLLSLLAVTGLVAVSSTSVLACGASNDNNEEPEDDTAARLELRDTFINETRALIQQYVSSQANNLIQSASGAENNNFFSFETLEALFNANFAESATMNTVGEDEVSINLSTSDINSALNDLDRLMSLTTILRNRVNEMAEQNQYSFLFENIDSSFVRIGLNPSISISRSNRDTSEGETSQIYTVSMKLQVFFQYNWLNQTETNEVDTDLNFVVSDNAVIVENITKIVNELPKLLWKNHSEMFKFNEVDLRTANTRFRDQSNSVKTYFDDNSNARLLEDTIANVITNDLNLSDTTIEFEQAPAGSFGRLFNSQFTQVIQDNGFIEQALFLKGEDTDHESKLAAFDTEFSRFNVSTFVNSAQQIILNNLGVEIDPIGDELEFIEYGFISLGTLRVYVLGVSVEINPINLLYTYNPTTSFQEQAIQTFNQWHESWNITESSTRGGLWRMRETNANNPEGAAMARDVWASIRTNPRTFLDGVFNERNRFYAAALAGTGFNTFHVRHNHSGRNPYASLDNRGYRINYSGYGNSAAARERSWMLVVTLDDVRITINLVQNPNYVDTAWNGTGANPTAWLVDRV